jgi:nitrogen PTS system EIIA component
VLKQLMTQESVWLDCECADKRSVLELIAQKSSQIIHLSHYHILEGLNARESLQSTATARGVAIPHCVTPDYNSIMTGFVRLKNPIDFKSADMKPCDLFFFIIASSDAGTDYLRLLARAARYLRQEDICTALRQAQTVDEVLTIFSA